MIFLALIASLCFALNGLTASQVVENQVVDAALLEMMPKLANAGKYWPDSTRLLVIVHQYDGDVRWAERLNFPHVIYEKNKPEKEPFTAINKAKGETNLLKFIAEFYDDLPENIIQVYQYEHKHHHDGSLVDILNSHHFVKEYAQSKTAGFWNFNNINMGNVAPQIPRMLESGWWPAAMAPWFGELDDYANFTEGKRSCAQFVVSRERIRTMPREFYVNMYFWLVNNTIGEVTTGYDPHSKERIPTPLDYHSNSNYFTSRYMEWSWELIFTSHKSHENCAIPYTLNSSNSRQRSNKQVVLIAALYGAKKYFRDVTQAFMSHFIRDDEIVIPATANFNHYFTDVVHGSNKTLIINIDGREFLVSETRSSDTIIPLFIR